MECATYFHTEIDRQAHLYVCECVADTKDCKDMWISVKHSHPNLLPPPHHHSLRRCRHHQPAWPGLAITITSILDTWFGIVLEFEIPNIFFWSAIWNFANKQEQQQC